MWAHRSVEVLTDQNFELGISS